MVWQDGVHEWREHLYALLGLVYYREPTREFIERLAANDPFSMPGPLWMDEGINPALRILSGSLQLYSRGVSDRDLEQLQGDHFQLFTGSGMPAAPPWASFYRTEERLMVSSHTLQVRALYDRFGLVSERKEQEPEDHVGLELEFMAFLCDRYRKCAGKGARREAVAILAAQKGFLDEHLLPWIRKFCEGVARSCWTGFYRGIGDLTAGFVSWDRGFLSSYEGEDFCPGCRTQDRNLRL
jgi:TorA maturation chaperone TorD